MSRLGSLVRIVSRNFEHFTDLSSDVYKNLQGRVYRYFGVATSFAGSVAEDYKYHQYYGDTAVAEAVKTSYANPPLSLPSAGPVIFKEQITGASGDYNGELMRRTVSLDGSEEVVVTNGTDFTRVKVTNGVVTVSFKDQQTITIDKDKIDVHHSSGADVLLDANGVKSTFSSGTVQMTSSEVSLLWGAHFCKVHDSGVDLG
ncbi:MAG TPA: hypothetical protein VFM18_08715 [Methanosarcina sp.]|nr:hypothetical protein [Methanosarcina sp.]